VGPNKTGEAQTIAFISTTQTQVDVLGDKSKSAPGLAFETWDPRNLSRRAVDRSAVSLHPKPSFLRRLGRNERGLSAFFYVGWSRHGFQSVDVEVFVKIKTEKFGCGPEDEGAVQ
jgi:hypothetical protein